MATGAAEEKTAARWSFHVTTHLRNVIAGIAMTLLMACGLLSCGDTEADDPVSLHGAGASFPAPVYGMWFEAFLDSHPEIQVSYESSSSGRGIEALRQGKVDFAGCDHALDGHDLERFDVEPLEFPLVGGCIALAYNLPGVTELKLTRRAYVDLFLGKIVRWNDPILQAIQPEVVLPDLDVTIVRREDSSGTTLTFLRHLAAIDERWRAPNGGPGVGETIEWPRNVQGKQTVATQGNIGVAHVVERTLGAIGYVGCFQARQTGLPLAHLENRAGTFVAPTLESARAALANVVDPHGESLADPLGESSYPLTTFSWLIVPRQVGDARKVQALKELLRFCATKGQEMASQLGYVSAPESVLADVLSRLDQLGS